MGKVETAKKEFLTKYNPSKTINEALSKAISASVQHNSLYKSGLNYEKKKRFRKDWEIWLKNKSTEYKYDVTLEDFKKDFQELVAYMNQNYSNYFRTEVHPRFNYDPGFRISHGQKSLSVFLKHLWSMNKIKEPPACPVDRIVLQRLGKTGADAKWTHVNSINLYNKQLGYIESAALESGLTIAQFEILLFKDS